MHPDFPEIVQGIREIRDRLRPQTKLVLFTNASTAGSTKIAEALRWIDVPIMKLDAGDQSTFSAVNQPLESITLQDIVDGMRPISLVIIQSMLINGDFNNVRGEAYESWANLLVDLKPKQVQIYTADRPTAYDVVGALEPKLILKIEDDLRQRFKLNVKAY